MSSEREDESEHEYHQHHAQLLTELPRADGSFGKYVYLYQGYWLYPHSILCTKFIQNYFKHQSNYIILSSFMKSGTTWLKSLMFTTLNRSRFDFSDHPLHRMGPQESVPFLDTFKPKDYFDINNDSTQLHSSPRLFATHLAHKLLPSSVTDSSSGCKFVYVCRDPKDVLVSLSYFVPQVRPKELPPLSFDQMFQMFCEGVVGYGPYWDHVLGYWEASLKFPGKILFFKYEEIKKDPEVHVKKLAEFMGVPISVQEEDEGMAKKIADFCSFGNLASLEINKTGLFRPNDRHVIPNQAFLRRGEVGEWKCHLTNEMKEQIDRITYNKFKDSGLISKYNS